MTPIDKTMTKKELPRTVLIIVAALALIFAATKLIKPLFLGSGMFPDLETAISDVRTIIIADSDHGEARSTRLSHADGKNWVVATAANAPADADKVRALIIGLTRLENAETKSSNPKEWPAMGLGARETRLTVTDSNNKIVADLRMGNAVPEKSGAQFLRLGEEGSAFIGFGLPHISASALTWTTVQLPKLTVDRIKRIQLIGTDLSRIDIERRDGSALAVANLAAGETTNEDSVNKLADVFKNLTATDMIAADAINWFNATTFLIDSNDGLNLSGQIKAQAGHYWVRINGSGTSPDAKTINSQKNLAFAVADSPGKILLFSRSSLVQKN